MPDPGVLIYELSGAMVGGSGQGPGNGPNPGGPKRGEPVDLATGLFVYEKTDLDLPDVIPIKFTRTYRPNDGASRAFGVGATHDYDIFLIGDVFPYTYLDLIMPDGGRVHYSRISTGTNYTDAIYQCSSTPGPFFASTIVWNGNGWTLTLRDRTDNFYLPPFPEVRDGDDHYVEFRKITPIGMQFFLDSRATRIATLTEESLRELFSTLMWSLTRAELFFRPITCPGCGGAVPIDVRFEGQNFDADPWE